MSKGAAEPPKQVLEQNLLLQKCNVLLVEDERLIREILCRQMKSIGITEVVEASSAESAWNLLTDSKSKGFNVVITDIKLPGISGAAFVKQLRSLRSPRAKKIPIIVLTGDSQLKTYRVLARYNISSYLIKPISADLLRRAIEYALGQSMTPPLASGPEVPEEPAGPTNQRHQTTPAPSQRIKTNRGWIKTKKISARGVLC